MGFYTCSEIQRQMSSSAQSESSSRACKSKVHTLGDPPVGTGGWSKCHQPALVEPGDVGCGWHYQRPGQRISSAIDAPRDRSGVSS